MSGMFWGSESFNQDISDWDVSSVTNMEYMFSYDSVFNQDIGIWDVSSVTRMEGMFFNNQAINQDLSFWNVGNVEFCDIFSDNTPQWTLPQPNFTNCTP